MAEDLTHLQNLLVVINWHELNLKIYRFDFTNENSKLPVYIVNSNNVAVDLKKVITLQAPSVSTDQTFLNSLLVLVIYFPMFIKNIMETPAANFTDTSRTLSPYRKDHMKVAFGE